MDKKQICIKFAQEICDILDISVPAIKFVSADRMRTSTQIAALTPDAVLIRNDMTISPELFFAIAHELRHSYQIANGADLKESLPLRKCGLKCLHDVTSFFLYHSRQNPKTQYPNITIKL